MVAVVVPLQRKAHGALVPAGAHMRAQHIVPGPHKGGHVIGLIAQVMVVARPAGGQLILPHLLPVQMKVIHPQGRGAQYSAFHGPVQADFPAEVCALGIAPVLRCFRRDELSTPGPVRHAGKEEGRGRPRAFLLRCPHPDAGHIPRAGPQRNTGNFHMGRFVAIHPAAVVYRLLEDPVLGQLQLIGRLAHILSVAFQHPAEKRHILYARELLLVVHPQAFDPDHAISPSVPCAAGAAYRYIHSQRAGRCPAFGAHLFSFPLTGAGRYRIMGTAR